MVAQIIMAALYMFFGTLAGIVLAEIFRLLMGDGDQK